MFYAGEKLDFDNRYCETFGTERDEGSWTKVHNEKLHNFHSSPNIMKEVAINAGL